MKQIIPLATQRQATANKVRGKKADFQVKAR